MPLNPKDPYIAIGFTSVICAVPTFLTTVYRLYIRQSRYWADDLLSLFATVVGLFLGGTSTFIHITSTNAVVKKDTRIAAYYLMACSYYGVIWLARLSMLFSIVRIHPPEYAFGFGLRFSTRKVLYLIAGIFSTILVVLLCQLFWVCEPRNTTTRWKEMERPHCPLTKQVVILQVVADFSSDLILVLIPLRLIQNISSPSLRHRLTWIFSTAIITTIVSIPHAIFIIRGMGTAEIITAYVQACVGLIVCNLPIVAARLMKMWGSSEPRGTEGGISSTWLRSIKFVSHSRSTESGTVDTSRSVVFSSDRTGISPSTSSWLKWDRNLRDEDDSESSSTPVPVPVRPVAIELDRASRCYEEEAGHEYPPSCLKKP